MGNEKLHKPGGGGVGFVSKTITSTALPQSKRDFCSNLYKKENTTRTACCRFQDYGKILALCEIR